MLCLRVRVCFNLLTACRHIITRNSAPDWPPLVAAYTISSKNCIGHLSKQKHRENYKLRGNIISLLSVEHDIYNVELEKYLVFSSVLVFLCLLYNGKSS